MMAIPDPASIDFTGIAGWASGIALVVASVGVVIWRAIQSAGKIAATLPPVQVDTKIMTADTVAMDRLAGTVEASNVILTENNVLRKEEHADRAANREKVEANTAAIEREIAVINELRADIRELTREIVRMSSR